MKEKIITFTFLSMLLIVSGLLIFTNDKELSFYERRKLMTKKDLKENIIDNLEEYASDQFPLRDTLISLNSLLDRYVFMNKEKNNVYIVDDYLVEKNYPKNEKSINDFINIINYINDNYLENSNVFYGIIPDKSYFLNDDYLVVDFEEMLKEVNAKLNIEYIDIINEFELSDYYKTDIHLKQGSYFKILNTLDEKLQFNYKKLNYDKNIFDNFYGASLSKVGNYIKSENLEYYVNNYIKNAKVSHLEFGEKKVYDTGQLNSVDAYNIFLSGPSSLIEIKNDNSLTNKELIIFRDSFASSLTPLLISYYKNITLIDLRYINMKLVPNYVDFDNKDVLFLYSTLIINNSSILKVN